MVLGSLEHLANKLGIAALASALAYGLALNDEREGFIWLYRMVIAVLLSILSTLFLADRFLPYPWIEDKPKVLVELKSLRETVDRQNVRLNHLEREVEDLRAEQRRAR